MANDTGATPSDTGHCAQEFAGFGPPCSDPLCEACRVTERDGLAVGDSVVIAGRWPCVVEGFNSLPNDVIVRWTGKRPDFSQDRSTVCRGELRAMGYTIEKVESHA